MSSLIGQKLGQYTIVSLLGKGGMATVYRAHQASMERDVAIKVIKPDLAEVTDFVARFRREARTIASLQHPHILKVFDYGEHGDLVYLVMELLRGGSLAETLRAGPLTVPVAGRILEQVASALDYAHKREIIHRDLKPQNVLLDDEGHAFLTDFGIAKLLTETSQFTQSGAVMGTPSYMAPEQWQGQKADARVDVYALGIMLYEMLTGSLPFRGETPASIMYMHLMQQPPSVRHVQPTLSTAFDEVINRAMAKDRDQRFRAAGEVALAFQAAVTGKPIEALKPTPQHVETTLQPPLNHPREIATEFSVAQDAARTNRTPASGFPADAEQTFTPSGGTGHKSGAVPAPPIGRAARRGIGAVIGVVVLLGMIGTVLLLAARQNAPGATPTTEQTLISAADSLTRTPSTSATVAVSNTPANLSVLQGSPLPLTGTASTQFMATQTSTPTRTLPVSRTPSLTITSSTTPSVTSSVTPTDTASSTSSPTLIPSATSTPTVTDTPSITPSATPTPDNEATLAALVAMQETQAAATVAVRVGATLTALTQNTAAAATVTLRAQATATAMANAAATDVVSLPRASGPLALQIGMRARIYVTDEGLRLRQQPGASNRALLIMPTGTLVDIIGGPRQADGLIWWNVQTLDGVIGWSVEAVDGLRTLLPLRIIFASTRDGQDDIYAMNYDGSNIRRLTTNSTEDDWPSLSPDGQTIVFASYQRGRNELFVMDADGSNQRLLLGGANDYDPNYSPDGSRIAFVSERDGNAEIYVVASDGTDLRRLTRSATSDNYPSWSPDGKQIVFQSNRSGNQDIWVMNADGSNLRQLTTSAANDLHPNWSPDGSRIVFASVRDRNSEIYVMNADGSNQRRLTDEITRDWTPIWSPDGREILFVAQRDGNREIYLMNADGTYMRNLTNNPAEDFDPTW